MRRNSKILIASLGVLLVGSVALGVSYGEIELPGAARGLMPAENTPPAVPGSTTTPQDVLDRLSNEPAKPQPEPGRKPTYGPLTNTYTDETSGFSLRYPDGLRVVHPAPGYTTLEDGKDKGFSLTMMVCTVDFPCAYNIDISARSLEDFKRGKVAQYPNDESSQTYGSNLSWKIVPTQHTMLPIANGKVALKQIYTDVILDEKGNDVTSKVCEMCGGPKTQYIAFRKLGEVLLITAGPFNDPSLEAKVIQTITY